MFCKKEIFLYKLNNLAFPFGVDFPDETGKMSQSDKRGASAAEAKWIF